MDKELAYFVRRAAEERQAGTDAANEEARRRHAELAVAYEQRVRELTEHRPKLRVISPEPARKTLGDCPTGGGA